MVIAVAVGTRLSHAPGHVSPVAGLTNILSALILICTWKPADKQLATEFHGEDMGLWKKTRRPSLA